MSVTELVRSRKSGAEKQKEEFNVAAPAINRPPLWRLELEVSLTRPFSIPARARPVPVWRRYVRHPSELARHSRTHPSCRWNTDGVYQRWHGPPLWLDRKSPRRQSSRAEVFHGDRA